MLRLRRPVLNAWSTAGLMMTTYYGGGRYNLGARRRYVIAGSGRRIRRAEVGGHARPQRSRRRRPGEPQLRRREMGAAQPARSLLHRAVHPGRPRLPARARLHAPPRLHHRQRRRQLVSLHRLAQVLQAGLPGGARVLDVPELATTRWSRDCTRSGSSGTPRPAAAAGSSRSGFTRTCCCRSASATRCGSRPAATISPTSRSSTPWRAARSCGPTSTSAPAPISTGAGRR